MEQTSDSEAVKESLSKGYPVIAAHGPGLFTGSGHFIVYAKLIGNDKLIVNDPNCGMSRNKNPDDYQWDLETVISDSGGGPWFIPTTDHTNISPLMNDQSAGGQTGKGLAGTLGVRSSKIKDHGSYVELMPSGKTYCEPVYPDYIYVQGNIPNTAVEDTVITNSSNKGTQVENYNIMTSQDMQDLTGIQMNAFTTDKAQALAQRAYNPEKAELEVKVPNAGKPLNNSDPYPVDLKIEELELHLPRAKQYKLPYDKKVGVTRDLASAILIL